MESVPSGTPRLRYKQITLARTGAVGPLHGGIGLIHRGSRQALGFLALSLIWGSTWAAIRVAVAHLPPLRSVSLRLLLASAILIPILFFRRQRRPTAREFALLCGFSVLTMAIPFSLVAWAEQRVSSGQTSLLFATSPLLTACLETWMSDRAQRRRIPSGAVTGMCLGLAGLALVLSRLTSVRISETRGVLAVVLVVFLGSAMSIVAKRRLRAIPVLTIVSVQTLMAGLVLGCVSLVAEQGRPSDWTLGAVVAMVFLGVFSSAVGFLLFYWLLMRMEPYELASRYLVMPVLAVFEGSVFLGEELSWRLGLGGAAVMAGLMLMLRTRATAEVDR